MLTTVAGAAASAGASGAPTFFAMLTSLLMLAAICFSRLRDATPRWRSVALVSLIERPG
jgi:uncharacterized membrane protein YhaH (DUF805 family)